MKKLRSHPRLLPPSPSPTALDKPGPISMRDPRLARTTCGALSVKPGNCARLTDKETDHGQEADQDHQASYDSQDRLQRPLNPRLSRLIVLGLLRRQNGASIAEIIEATDWQPHSVRGFFAGALKKRLKIEVISDKGEDGIRRYYVAPLRGEYHGQAEEQRLRHHHSRRDLRRCRARAARLWRRYQAIGEMLDPEGSTLALKLGRTRWARPRDRRCYLAGTGCNPF